MKKGLRIAVSVIAVLLLMVILVFGYLMIFERSLVRTVWVALTESRDDIEKNIEQSKEQLKQEINNAGYTISDEQLEKLGKGELNEDEITDILLGKDFNDILDASDENVIGENEQNTETEDETKNDEDIENADETETESETKNEDVSDKPQQVPEDKKPSQNVGKPQQGSSVTKPSQTDKTDKTETAEKNNKTDVKTENVTDSKKPQQSESGNQQAVTDERVARLIAKMYVLKSQYVSSINGLISEMKAEYVKRPKE